MDKNQKDLSLGLDLLNFVGPQFSHLQNGVQHFYFRVHFERDYEKHFLKLHRALCM